MKAHTSLRRLAWLALALWLPAACAARGLAAPTPAPPPISTPEPTATPSSPTFVDTSGGNAAPPFHTLAGFQQMLAAAVASGDVEPFWRQVVAAGQMPLIFGENAVFLYRGPATSVGWAGDFTRWWLQPAELGQRQGESDIWMLAKQFPRDAIVDYMLEVDGGDWILDPLNPVQQVGSDGAHSVVRMPGWVYPEITRPRQGILHGTLNKDVTIASKRLGYDVVYRVYTPPDYEKLDRLPVIYATDGEEFDDLRMGAMPVVLDNLLADGAIRPVIAVFVDPRDPITGTNRRYTELATNDAFVAFLAEELVPAVDAAYRTDPAPRARLILGLSLGALTTAYIAQAHPELFGMAGLLSPYLRTGKPVISLYEGSPRLPLIFFMSQGIYDTDVENTRRLRDVLQAKGYPLEYNETQAGHSWSNWRSVLEDALVYFFRE